MLGRGTLDEDEIKLRVQASKSVLRLLWRAPQGARLKALLYLDILMLSDTAHAHFCKVLLKPLNSISICRFQSQLLLLQEAHYSAQA